MANATVQIPWGNELVSHALPDPWHVAGVLEPSSVPPVADAAAEALRALSEPIGMPALSALVRPGMKIAVVMDDGSRPTPVAAILPAVTAELSRCGVDLSAVRLVAALGVHRPMEQDEAARRAGPAGAELVFENPDCDDPQRMAFLGTTSRGTPVWINSTVAEADLVISVGCIEPHIIASFGGGYKNIVPGVAGRATIAHNHAINCSPSTFNMVGQPIERNPMRQDLEEAAGMLAKQPHQPRLFIVNAILDHRQRVVKIVAGSPIDAHRAGAAYSASMYGVKIQRQADVVITASHPMDQDLRQGVKALANTIRAVKPGGVMITLVRAEEGTGVFGLANRKLPLGRRAIRLLAPLLVRAVPRLKLKGMGEEDRFFLYFALQAMQLARLIMVAPTIPAEVQERLPFVEFAPTTEAALALARARFPKHAEVLIFPHGGITYPELG